MKPFKRGAGFWLVNVGMLCAGLLLSGCKTRPFSPYDLGPGPRPDGLKLKAGETVVVKFSGTETKIEDHIQKINDDGTINLQYLSEPVEAAGKTTSELAQHIRDEYVRRQLYNTLNVTVEAPNRYYVVGGDVRRPERQAYIGPTTLLQAIQAAGGFTDFADKRRVIVTRSDGEQLVVDCIRALRDPSIDVPVYPGDNIYVQRALL